MCTVTPSFNSIHSSYQTDPQPQKSLIQKIYECLFSIKEEKLPPESFSKKMYQVFTTPLRTSYEILTTYPKTASLSILTHAATIGYIYYQINSPSLVVEPSLSFQISLCLYGTMLVAPLSILLGRIKSDSYYKQKEKEQTPTILLKAGIKEK